MPLIKSGSKQAFGRNVAEMIRAGHPRDQALAAAYATARKAGKKFASGGAPWWERSASRSMIHPGGMLHSSVPGRTDKLPLNVKAGSYVLPADIPSALGQGNSQAGANVLNKMFSGPYGMRMNLRPGRAVRPHKMFADGGEVEQVPIIAAGGEYIIPPETIIEKYGDLDYGHEVLDKFVKQVRDKHIKTLKSLPGPKTR